ncbi:MAG: pilus assembly protein [Actinobacteria bacterium]|nr:pilus assembly protein [Actinomycetota bacterium]
MVNSNFNPGQNKGSVLLIVAILLPVFILLLGFVVDIGRAFLYKEEINKACMVAAEEASKCIDIKAAQEFGVNRLADNYPDIIYEFFYKNYKDTDDCSINNLQYNVIESIDNPKYIEVYCEADVRCFFLKIISINSITIHTKANGRLRRIK